LKQIFSYYTTAVKLTAEGDVHLSDEALSGLGRALTSLRYPLFGAIIQIYDPTYRTSTSTQYSTHVTRPPETHPSPGIDIYEHIDPSTSTIYEDDPHLPLKPARRKDTLPQQDGYDDEQQRRDRVSLTDLVPNVGYFAAGGLAGITSRTVTAPLDRLKVYLIAQTGNASDALEAAKKGAPLQATKHGASTLWNACKELWAAGGVRSLFAGMDLN
jgi:solute carrier family 25 (mitochondrial phosphate transporter), member 23/24/25/41